MFLNFEDREECSTSNCMYFERQIHWCTQITNGNHPLCIRKTLSGTFRLEYFLYIYIASGHLLQLYIWAGSRNQLLSFFKWKVWSGRSHWNHLGFLISISGVRNVLQSQEVFLIDAKSNFFNFEDREESYTSNCMYFEREIHWCTQNHLWTSSSMHQKGSIRNISDPILPVHIQGGHIGTIWGSGSPSQESGRSYKVRKHSWWMQSPTF